MNDTMGWPDLLFPSAPPMAMSLAAALLLAWGLDACFGEPPNAWHPVAWLGRLLGPLGRRLRGVAPAAAFIGGAMAWMLIALALAAAGWWVQAWLLQRSPWWAVPLLALLLKPLFAWRMLRDEVAAVEAALQRGLEPARERLARLVSRDVSSFDDAALRETAIETLAENLNDSVISPLFWFAVAGLPAALVYRFANTADAMWGYRGEWEWAGKWAARADDVLSWPGARLTALALYPLRNAAAWRALRREAAATTSPNGGWPMGAMALRLGVRLSKPGVYVLNESGSSPGAHHLQQALAHARTVAWLGAGLAALAWWGRAA